MFAEMAVKKWETFTIFVVFFILHSCNIDNSYASAESHLFSSSESAESSTQNSTVKPSATNIDKYKCEHYFSDISTVERNRLVNSTKDTNKLPESTSTISAKLNCSEADIKYKNITEDEFVSGVHGNGVLELSTGLQAFKKFEFREYCVAEYNGTGSTVRIALCDGYVQHEKQEETLHPTYSTFPVALRKCCPSTSRLEKTIEYGRESFKCVKTNTKWNPAIFNSTEDEYDKHKDLDLYVNQNITYGFPQCSGPNSLNNSKDIWFVILSSGSVEIGLKFWFKPVWLPVEDKDFCLDEFLDHDPSLHNETEIIDSHHIYHKNQILMYCRIAHFDDYLFHRRLFGGICVTAAGVVFILLVIYVAIWDRQNLAGWTQFNIFVALFFVVLMEGLRTLIDADALQVRSTTTCVIVAAIAQYFFFALNCTWSVMCYDLFSMFWKLETTSKNVARYRNRLIVYLLISWGAPLVVVCICFFFYHHSATEEMDEMKGVYAFAHRRCSSPIRKLGFQTQGILFLINLVFFFFTTLLLWKHRRGLNAARKRSRSERHTWRSVRLFMKLVIVMGVASLSIPIDYFFVSSTPLSNTAICFRMVHFIPFFAVLFIFGFNEKNMILISQKYPRVGKYFGFVACTSGATASDTANHSRSGNANRISEHTSSPT